MKIHSSVVLVLGVLTVATQLTQVSGSANSQRHYHLRALGDKPDGGDDHKVCTITNESQCDGQNWTFSTCCVDDKYECRWDDEGQDVKRCQLKEKKDGDDCSDSKDKMGRPGKGDQQQQQRPHDDGKDDSKDHGKPDHGRGGKDSEDGKPGQDGHQNSKDDDKVDQKPGSN